MIQCSHYVIKFYKESPMFKLLSTRQKQLSKILFILGVGKVVVSLFNDWLLQVTRAYIYSMTKIKNIKVETKDSLILVINYYVNI